MSDRKNESQRGIEPSLLSIFILIGIAFGYIINQLVGYFSEVFRQPKFTSKAFTEDLKKGETLVGRAASIAANNLVGGIEKRPLMNGDDKLVLNAGSRNFREPWARDFGFASYGLMALGEHRAVKECLDVFFLHQRPDGQFPVKIHSTGVLNRYIHTFFKREQPIKQPLKPKYVTGHRTISLDGNALLIIAAINYARHANGSGYSRKKWDNLRRAAYWLKGHAHPEDGLLHQGAFSDWADTVARQGRVLYTNILYWKALTELAEFAGVIGFEGDRSVFAKQARSIKLRIKDHFWRKDLGYFVTNEKFDNLSSGGNLLAIAWELIGREKSISILEKMKEFGMAKPVPTQPVHRPYPLKFIAIENRLGGLAFYHTDAAWIWLGSWHAIAYAVTGQLKEAHEIITTMSEVIVRDGEVHEVYDSDGNYLSKMFYTSEAPLTWSAGMFVYACHYLEKMTSNPMLKPTGDAKHRSGINITQPG